MKYTSVVGKPLEIENPIEEIVTLNFAFTKIDYRGWKMLGTTLGGFVFPENMLVSSKIDLFSRYGLWENTLGINLTGTPIIPINRIDKDGGAYMISLNPIFVGDITLNGEVVVSTKGIYDTKLKIWKCFVSFGTLAGISNPIGASEFNKAVVDAFQQLATSILTLVSTATYTVGEVTTTIVATSTADFNNTVAQINTTLEANKC